MLDINKQKMLYSLPNGRGPVYELDENGDVKYIVIDGESVPVITGETETAYEEPVKFFANISNKLSEALMKEFGIDQSTNYVQIASDKGRLPLTVGSLVWKKSSVAHKNLRPDPKSADYKVIGVADEGLTVDLFLLQKNVK
jgi:hypothetical protein|nr:MAG TPA: hypothetical protein [Caudoviricetes sp.]